MSGWKIARLFRSSRLLLVRSAEKGLNVEGGHIEGNLDSVRGGEVVE